MSAGSAVRPDIGLVRREARAATPAVVAVCVLTLLGAALRVWRIGHQGFWFDEANTAMLVHLSPGKMLGLLPQSESTPPLYYCIAWVWARVFGFGEAGLRSLSAVAGTLTIPVAYGVAANLFAGNGMGSGRRWGTARRDAGARAGLVAAALTTFNPFLIWYSQEARSYSLLVLLTGVSLLAFVRARASPSPRRLALWVVAAALALATHYYALVAVVPQALWLLAEHRRRRGVQIAFAVVALCGLALLPLALSQNGTGNDSWIATAPFGERLRQIIPQFLIGTDMSDRTLFKYVAYALALVALALLALRARAEELRPAAVAGALALAGFALALIMVGAGFDDLITRNIIALWLPAAVAVAGGLAVARARRLGALVAAGLCAIGVVATVGIALDRNLQRPDWRYVARALGSWPAPDSTGSTAAAG
ncbi:MAG: glycosyltransferase family 39 protein, partial [Solirubrobacteraceae bacterium]